MTIHDPTIYVVLWSYADNSSFGVVGVYSTEERANNIVKLLREHADTRSFSVVAAIWELP